MVPAVNEVRTLSSDGSMPPGTLWRLLIGIALLAASLVLLTKTLNSTAITVEAVKWGGIALAVYIFALLALMLAIRGAGRGPASWRLGPWLMIWVATMFGFASSINLGNFQFGLSAQVILNNVLGALWLVAAGMTMWVLGYLIGPGRLIGKSTARWTESLGRRYTGEIRSHWTPWLLYGIGSAARIILLLTTARLGYVGDAASAVTTASWYSHALASLGYCAPAGVAAAMLAALRRPAPGSQATAIVLILAEIGYALASGDKTDFIVLIMAVFIPYTAERGRPPGALFAALIIIFLVVVIPFNAAYRQNARSGTSILSVGQAVSAAPQLLGDTLGGGNGLAATVLASVDTLLNRGQYIADVAIIMQRTPSQIPYLPASQMFTGPVSLLIPRVLWPGKPIYASGYYFGQEYLGVSPKEYTSAAITPLGSLYRYGGWVPLIAGMLFLGFLFRMLDDIIDVRGNPHTLFIPLLTFQVLVTAEQDWDATLVTFVLFVPVWVLTVVLAFSPKRRMLA